MEAAAAEAAPAAAPAEAAPTASEAASTAEGEAAWSNERWSQPQDEMLMILLQAAATASKAAAREVTGAQLIEALGKQRARFHKLDGIGAATLCARARVLLAFSSAVYEQLLPWINLAQAGGTRAVATMLVDLKALVLRESKEAFWTSLVRRTEGGSSSLAGASDEHGSLRLTLSRHEAFRALDEARAREGAAGAADAAAAPAAAAAAAAAPAPTGETNSGGGSSGGSGGGSLPRARPLLEQMLSQMESRPSAVVGSARGGGGGLTAGGGLDVRVLLHPRRAFHVRFEGEAAVDQGGPYREAMDGLCAELSTEVLTILRLTPNWEPSNGMDDRVFNPRATSQRELRMLELMGALMGVALRTKTPLLPPRAVRVAPPPPRAPHPRRPAHDRLAPRDAARGGARRARLLGGVDRDGHRDWHRGHRARRARRNHVGGGHRDGHRVGGGRGRRRRRRRVAPPRAPLVMSPEAFDATYEAACVTFTYRRLDGEEVELKPGGASLPLTFDTREEWCALIEEARRREGDAQVAAVRRGLAQLVPLPALSLFTAAELERMVCGNSDWGVELLKANCSLRIGSTDPRVEWLWAALAEFSSEERALFLKFAWGPSRLPSGVARLPQAFVVADMHCSGNPDDYLPASHACFFTIDMPKYTNAKSLKEKLLFAIYNCATSRSREGVCKVRCVIERDEVRLI